MLNYKNKDAEDYVELAPFMLELIDQLEKSEIPFELANRKTWKNFPHLYYPNKTRPKCIVNAPLHGGKFDTLYLTMNGLIEPSIAPSKSNDPITSEKGLLPEVVYARILQDWKYLQLVERVNYLEKAMTDPQN